jgi:hypothetical protein
MLPEEREMAKKYAGKPVTLLGINSDQSRSALKKIMADEKITWPNIHGGPASNNPIARDWSVSSWPTVYILDHEGVIRHKNPQHKGLTIENAVNELLAKVPPKEQ